ncbi:cobalt ABC transporter, permease protein CbiQ [Synechococcus sp. PCC 7335]|uniref:cobalt ECF transporter T component CbiQ n=1 Tax=Synechococcus sp. (strain ATCC 29403 / PCC 7335) TaxID=91464 RepID=UPI00017EDC6B|nr:cobalt ECF transporter T component CbiQ [Synechococcus sp. PCC 7335]EDX83870.1 cobalt ABC transporter, permease protein CbiQ [Synechococcus sp. PCC 7335]
MAMANFETYVSGRSRLHSWTPRLKLVSLGLLMFAFAAIRGLPLVLPMLCFTAILYFLSELPFSFLLKRLRYPGLFILMVVLVLPFSSGETILWQWGALALRQEGVEAMVLIVGRFLSILTLGFVLLGTTPFVTLLRALRSLGLPNLIADMTLLTYRYLFETAEMLSTMQRSMRLRGFGQQRRRFRLQRQDLQRLAGLLGTLLIRSYERSERVYKAMQLRGYGQLKQPVLKASVDSSSVLLTGLCIIAALSFVVADFSLSAPNL